MLPVLYSYRRCPYAMRARMALKIAEIEVEIREISLRNKPRHMLQISTKGTVPVLLLPDGDVIDESLAIMLFALQAHAMGANIHADARAYDLVLENDSSFKRALDAYKYPERNKNKTQEQHRADGETRCRAWRFIGGRFVDISEAMERTRNEGQNSLRRDRHRRHRYLGCRTRGRIRRVHETLAL